MDKLTYPSCGSVIKSRKIEQIESTYGTYSYFKMGNDEFFSYVDSSILCNVIKYFTLLNQIIRQEYITFPLSSISRGIEWQNKISIELEYYTEEIDTSLYHDFTINERYLRMNSFLF